MTEFAVSLSIFDGENAPFRTPLDHFGGTQYAMKLHVAALINKEADKAEKNGVDVHIVAEVLTRFSPTSVYYELDRNGDLVVCSDQVTPH